MTTDRKAANGSYDDTVQFRQGLAFPPFGKKDNFDDATAFDWLGMDFQKARVWSSDFHLAAAAAPDGPFVAETDETTGSPSAQAVADANGIIRLSLDTADEAQFAQVTGRTPIPVPVTDADLSGYHRFEARVRVNTADLPSNYRLVMGVVDDSTTVDVDATGFHQIFRIEGDGSDMALLWEVDDGAVDDDDNAFVPAITLEADTWIDLAVEATPATVGGSHRFFVNGEQVYSQAMSTAYMLALIGAAEQDIVLRLQKDSGTDAATVDIDWIRVWSPR